MNVEAEYDHILTFLSKCPFALGDEVKNGIIQDDVGSVVRFHGSAYVVAIEEQSPFKSSPFPKFLVYIKIHPPIIRRAEPPFPPPGS